MEAINIADIKNPETGKTFREENNELQHKYKVDDLVEIIPSYEDCVYGGMRLYIIGCTRDCDGTPLYVLGSKGMELHQTGFNLRPNVCYNFNSFSGFNEQSLKLIKQSNNVSYDVYEYEMFIDDKGSPFEINTWIPVATDRIKDIDKALESGLVRKIK
jgi:hypothetical protein